MVVPGWLKGSKVRFKKFTSWDDARDSDDSDAQGLGLGTTGRDFPPWLCSMCSSWQRCRMYLLVPLALALALAVKPLKTQPRGF